MPHLVPLEDRLTPDLRSQLQTTLGDAYTVERELGGGGMSRVFVATDRALERQIVVKMLPSEAAPSVSLERFNREIRVAARLQHPHIVPVLSAGESGGLPFYTMPFVKGESLRLRLSKGGELSVKDTLHVLRDVAAALAYAHGEGVVHRDIKPENVMLSGGVAVVTDFGVAKAVDLAVTQGGHSATGLTSLGVALGTPAYMSPEQATADPHVDHRSDIYSFGCIAYEMLAGTTPFSGRAPQQLLAAHVQEPVVPIDQRRPTVPPALAALIMKCLEKRSGDRPQSAEELLAALDSIATPSGGTSPTAARLTAAPRPQRTRLTLAAGALVVAAGVVAVLVLRPDGAALLQVGQATVVASSADIEMEPAISPDGRFVAFTAGPVAQRRIFVQQIAGGRPVMLTGDLDGDHLAPRWSPDGSRLVFEANFGAYVVAALGGTPRLLFGVDSGAVVTPTWSPDGSQIAYGDARGIWVRPAEGGTPRLVAVGAYLHSPAWSPDGRLIAFLDGIRASLNNVSPAAIRVVPAAGGAPTAITDATAVHTSVAWAADGRSLLFVSNRDGTPDVFQQAVHPDGRPRGTPVRLTTGLLARNITLSADGNRMAYDIVRNRSNVWSVDVPVSGTTTMDAARQVTRENQRTEGMRVSHDGQWLAFDADRGGNSDVYKIRLTGGEQVQLTSTPGNEFNPSWSPDDRELAYHSVRSGDRDLYIISAEGSAERSVTRGEEHDFWPDWSPDGRALVFGSRADTAAWTIQVIERDAQASSPAAQTPGGFGTRRELSRLTLDPFPPVPRWSPDGSLIAYVDAWRCVVVAPTGGSPRVLADMTGDGEGATGCVWGRSPSTLFFNTVSAAGRYSFWSVPVSGGAPRLLLRDDPARRVSRWDFDTDGKRLFFTLAADESDVWVVELKR